MISDPPSLRPSQLAIVRSLRSARAQLKHVSPYRTDMPTFYWTDGSPAPAGEDVLELQGLGYIEWLPFGEATPGSEVDVVLTENGVRWVQQLSPGG